MRKIPLEFISFVIYRYLSWRYPITSQIDGHPIPTVPYQWPNGQGDVAKFLEGEKNSQSWRAKYGSLYRIWSGTTPEMQVLHLVETHTGTSADDTRVVTAPEDIQHLFFDSDKHIKAVNNDSGWLMGELLGKCLGLISGESYQKVKAGTAAHFTQKISTSYLARIQTITDEYFVKLSQEPRLKRHLIDPVEDLKFLPFWILVDILYGELTPQLRSQIKGLAVQREELWARMIEGGVSRFSFARHLPIRLTTDLQRFKKEWRDFNNSVYEACVLAQEDTTIVRMYTEVKRGALGEEEVLQTVDEMLFANLDVTMGGLSWNLLFLAKYQETQEEIRDELRRAASSDTTGSREDYLKRPSTLLAYSILESSRLKPLAAFTVPQSAPTPRTIQGFHVPAKTNFIIDTYALNIKNPYWGHDSEEYRPFRFSDKKQYEMRYQFWRFGFGPRQCLGKYVVDLIIRSSLAYLIENYCLSLADTSNWDKNPTTWILHPKTQIRCEPLRR
ncbi:uncharacterized protein N0V89_001746 [Didymosphaeria variabile]|uniref:Cytochrome P450 n=1 Tax=Didymosphaeria variabile TaxID=1932322 RepID=A0A9W9CCW0_9PLEO|nr:uncharacterized protein N0V89_001746 [Didymosphaeria variabile]KAJ4357171.1 hypothetical protein N0V89_001746 [Didymosphaeria variabile]